MVKVIMGLKGSGKTKQLIELVTKAVDEESGDVVCIEKNPKLTYDIPYKVRLIDVGHRRRDIHLLLSVSRYVSFATKRLFLSIFSTTG